MTRPLATLNTLLIAACAWALAACVASPLRTALPDFASLVASNRASVVNVSVMRRVEGSSTTVRAQASGFVVRADGFILTGAHVVQEAASITIRLNDRREFRARLVGSDPMSDIAVLKIEAANLPVVRFGDPSHLAPGQWVVAIGSPFGFENSVSAGVVSGMARSLPDSNYVPFIQTDVTLNPGNSGGPLFNLDGEVIGVNSQVASNDGNYTGISFAVPIDIVRSVEQQLIQTGHVVRSRIGVMLEDVSAPLAAAFGLDRARGALVITVERGTPAETCGIKPGDVILRLDASSIEHYSEFSTLIARIKPDTLTQLTLWRDGAERVVSVRTRQVREPPVSVDPPHNEPTPQADTLGLSLTETSPAGSLLVAEATGPAALAGIEAGDAILAINGASITNATEFRSALRRSRGVVAVLIERKGQQIFVPVAASNDPT